MNNIHFSFKEDNKGLGNIEWIEMSGGNIPEGWTKTLSISEVYRYLIYYQKKEEDFDLFKLHVRDLLLDNMSNLSSDFLDAFRELGIDI